MQVGDWIEFYDAPSTRGVVTDEDCAGLVVLVHGEQGARCISNEELETCWQPLPIENGATEPPAWVQPGVGFDRRDTRPGPSAIICEVRPGWVAYFDYPPGAIVNGPPTFRMERWTNFHDEWTPETAPTAWERLLEALD